MLGLLLIYFIWKYYSELAFEFNKSKWQFGLLGIASYYGGAFVAAFLMGIIGTLADENFADGTSDLFWSLLSMPFGILTVWGLYRVLKSKWSLAARFAPGDSLDSDLLKTKG